MSSEITALGKCFFALGAGERPLTSMLSKVVAQIAALLEDRGATAMSALEIQFNTHGFVIADSNRLVPVPWNTLKSFGFGPTSKCLEASSVLFNRQIATLL